MRPDEVLPFEADRCRANSLEAHAVGTVVPLLRRIACFVVKCSIQLS